MTTNSFCYGFLEATQELNSIKIVAADFEEILISSVFRMETIPNFEISNK